jgi:hypothetical protein
MPSNREDLQARIAALQSELAALPSSPFVQEVAGAARPDEQPAKTMQVPPRRPAPSSLPLPPMPSNDPVVIAGQIAQITQLISSGVNSAGYGDKRTEFRSLSDLRQILDDLKQDLAAALGFGGRIRQIRMTMQADKGL